MKKMIAISLFSLLLLSPGIYFADETETATPQTTTENSLVKEIPTQENKIDKKETEKQETKNADDAPIQTLDFSKESSTDVIFGNKLALSSFKDTISKLAGFNLKPLAFKDGIEPSTTELGTHIAELVASDEKEQKYNVKVLFNVIKNEPTLTITNINYNPYIQLLSGISQPGVKIEVSSKGKMKYATADGNGRFQLLEKYEEGEKLSLYATMQTPTGIAFSDHIDFVIDKISPLPPGEYEDGDIKIPEGGSLPSFFLGEWVSTSSSGGTFKFNKNVFSYNGIDYIINSYTIRPDDNMYILIWNKPESSHYQPFFFKYHADNDTLEYNGFIYKRVTKNIVKENPVKTDSNTKQKVLPQTGEKPSVVASVAGTLLMFTLSIGYYFKKFI